MGFYLNVRKMDHKSKGHVFIDSHVCHNGIKNMKPFKVILLHQFIYMDSFILKIHLMRQIFIPRGGLFAIYNLCYVRACNLLI